MNTRRIFAAKLTSWLVIGALAHGATFTWDGGGSGSNWSTPGNWNPDGAPPDDGTADIILVGSTDLSPIVNAADGNWSIRSLTFGAFSLGFDLGGGPLTVGAGGITNNDDSIQEVSNSIVLSAPQTWSTLGGAPMNVSGPVNNAGHLLTIHSAAGNVALGDTISGAGGLTKTGATSLTFNGPAYTYAGITTVNEGTLLVSNTGRAFNNALIIGDGVNAATVTFSGGTPGDKFAATSDVTINPGGRLNLNGTNTIDGLTINGGFIGGGTSLSVNSLTLTGGPNIEMSAGSFILNGNLTTNPSADPFTSSLTNIDLAGATRTFTVADGAAAVDLDWGGTISNGGILKTGAGSLELGSANTFALGLTVNAGELIIGSNSAAGTGTLTLNSGVTIRSGGIATVSNPLVFADNVVFGGTSSLTFSAPLTLTANRTLNVTNTGVTTFSGVISQNAAGRQLIKTGSGALGLSSANTFSGGVMVNAGELVLGNDVGAGTGTITLAAGTTIRGVTAARTIANPVVFAGDATIGGAVALTFTNVSGLTGNRTLTVANSALTTISNAIGENAGGRTLTKAGPGVLLLSGANTFSGGLTLNAGALAIGNNGALGSGTLRWNTATIRADTAARTLSNSVILTGNGTVDGTVELTFSGVIGEDAPGRSLTKNGTALLRLTAANSFSGGITLSAGQLALGNNTAAGTGTLALGTATLRPDATAVTLANPVTLAGNPTLAGTVDLTFSGPVTLTGNRSLAVSNTAVTAFTGNIGQDAPGRTLTKTGVGTLKLSTANSFSGGLTLSSGELALGDNGAAGTGTLSLAGGTLRADLTPRTISNPLTLAGNVILGGALDLTFTGATLLNGNRTITVSNTALTSLHGNITEDTAGRSLTKTGTGTLILTGANNYTGTTTISAGTVVLSNASGLNSISGPVTVGDGLNDALLRFTQSNQIADGHALVVNPAGVLDLASFDTAETVTALTVNSGSVEIGDGSLSVIGSPALIMQGGAITSSAIGTLGVAGNLNTNASSSSATISATVDLNGGTRTFFINNGSAPDDLVISGSISNGSLFKAGLGRLVLSGFSTYAGNTTVSAGTLVISGSITASSTIVNNGGILGGTGIAGSVTVNSGGTLSPGASPGTLTTAALNLQPGSTSLYELASAGAVGGPNDLTVTNGNLTLDGTLAVTELAGFTNGTYRLFNYSGTFTDNGLELEPGFLTTHPGSTVSTATPGQVNLLVIPEPSSIALFASMVAILALPRRRVPLG